MRKQCLHNMAATLCALALSQYAVGNDHDDGHDTDQGASHGAHVHGIAELNIVLEGTDLAIDLHSPAMNLLGFEHRADNPEELAKVATAQKFLADANSLFSFNDGGCTLKEQSLDFPATLTESKSTQDHDKDHNDIEAHYRYSCTQPNELSSIALGLHDVFPGIESLQVQWIVNGLQGAITLKDDVQELHFR